jgi:hypothetical protein
MHSTIKYNTRSGSSSEKDALTWKVCAPDIVRKVKLSNHIHAMHHSLLTDNCGAADIVSTQDADRTAQRYTKQGVQLGEIRDHPHQIAGRERKHYGGSVDPVGCLLA